MADPVVHITAGIPDSGTGNITTLGQTLTDGANATLGANADAASATGSISAKLRGIATALGLTALDLGSGTGGSRTLRIYIDPGSQNANGTTTDANSTPVAQSTETKAQFGSLTETAPASDTASSGLNGRLQRIAQRITSTIGLLPTALGSAGGLKVDDIYGNYETVAASQTAQAMGATGATGDYLAYVEVFPGTAACGVVTILDNASTWGTFAGGGTTALPSLVPFRIDVGAYSTSGAWKITTGANVTCVGVGKFT